PHAPTTTPTPHPYTTPVHAHNHLEQHHHAAAHHLYHHQHHHDLSGAHDNDDEHQYDLHDHAAGDLYRRLPHPHGVPHPDGEPRLVEHQGEPVSPVHQRHLAADRLAPGAVLQPA